MLSFTIIKIFICTWLLYTNLHIKLKQGQKVLILVFLRELQIQYSSIDRVLHWNLWKYGNKKILQWIHIISGVELRPSPIQVIIYGTCPLPINFSDDKGSQINFSDETGTPQATPQILKVWGTKKEKK